MPQAKMNSLFLYHAPDLEAEVPGGVQICSREFLQTVRAASDRLDLFSLSYHPGLGARLRFRLLRDSYSLFEPGVELDSLYRTIEDKRITHVFINKSELSPYAAAIKERYADKVITVILSHGNQSGDDLYEFAGECGRFRMRGAGGLLNALRLGHNLIRESTFRRGSIDAVITLSHEEEVLERWLGASRVVYLPRHIEPNLLDWRPVRGRAGFVGTLDHTPNRVALEKIGGQIQNSGTSGINLRVVGRPVEAGVALAGRFPSLSYLGPLGEEELQQEVQTWSLMLNPVFWMSRGASMKLARALGWGIPTLSTRSGTRGYQTDGYGIEITEDRAEDFCGRLAALLDAPERIEEMRTRSIVRLQDKPMMAANVQQLRDVL